MNQVKVSVIIPVYNTPEKYLRQCLDSVLEQSLQALQIILVDDCSTDGSLEILKAYRQKDPRILLIQGEKNQGISASRNAGAKQVAGEYLYFLDCDDYLEPFALEELYTLAKEKNLDTLLFQTQVFYETEALSQQVSRKANENQYPEDIGQVKTGKEWFEILEAQCKYTTAVWLQLVKTDYYQKNNFSFQEVASCVGEDWVFTLENFLRGERMAGVAKIYHHYRVRENSGSTKHRDLEFFSRYVGTYLTLLLLVQEGNIPEERLEPYEHYLEMLALTGAKNYREITGEEPTQVEETLRNLKNLMFQRELITLETWETFGKNRVSRSALCFFGAGLECDRALEIFSQEGWNLPVAICDNSPGKQGGKMGGIPVVSLESALQSHPEAVFLITNRRYYYAIEGQIRKKVAGDRLIYLSF